MMLKLLLLRVQRGSSLVDLIYLVLVKFRKGLPKVGYISIDILTDLLEAARKPSVAAIDGLTLGGGLELSMAYHARISAHGAQLGFPELQLGVIPGFGVCYLCSFWMR